MNWDLLMWRKIIKRDKGYEIFGKLSSSESPDGENWAGILIPLSTFSSIFIILSSAQTAYNEELRFEFKIISKVE